MSDAYDKLHMRATAQVDELRKAIALEKICDNTYGIKHMSRAIHDGNAQPLLALVRTQVGTNGEPIGAIATDPVEVDSTAKSK